MRRDPSADEETAKLCRADRNVMQTIRNEGRGRRKKKKISRKTGGKRKGSCIGNGPNFYLLLKNVTLN